MFEVGDIVEVIRNYQSNGLHPSLTVGQKFVVNDIGHTCKSQYIDIGLTYIDNREPVKCPSCKVIVNYRTPLYEYTFFRKIQPNYKLVEVSESITKQSKELILS